MFKKLKSQIQQVEPVSQAENTLKRFLSSSKTSLTQDGDSSVLGSVREVSGETDEHSQRQQSFASGGVSRSRQSSVSSLTSDSSFLVANQAKRQPRDTSDLESEADTSVSGVGVVTKHQLFHKFTHVQGLAHKYRTKFYELLESHKAMELERDKMKNALTKFQDRSLQRMSELREQIQLDQQAKRDLEDYYRLTLDEKDELNKVLKIQVSLLKEGKDLPPELETKIRTKHELEANERRDLAQKNKELKDEVELLRSRVNKFEEALVSQNEKYEDRIDDWSKQYALLQNRSQELVSDNEKYKRKIEDLSQKLRAAKSDSIALVDKVKAELSTKLSTRDAEIQKLKSDLFQMNSCTETVGAENGFTNTQRTISSGAEDTSDGTTASHSVVSLKAEVDKLKKLLVEKGEEYALAIEERDMQKNAAISLSSEQKSVLEDKLASVESKKAELEKQLEVEKTKYSEMIVEFTKKLDIQLEKFEAEKDNILSVTDDKIKKLQKEHADEIEHLQVEYTNNKRCLEEQLAERLLSEKSELQQELEAEYKSSFQNSQQQFKEVLKDKQDQIDYFKDLTSNLEIQVKTYTQNTDEIGKSLEEKNAEIQRLREEMKALTSHNESLLDDMKVNIQQLEGQLVAAREESHEKDLVIEDFNNKLSNVGQEKQLMQSRIAELETSVVEIATHKESLQRMLDEISIECEDLKKCKAESASDKKKLTNDFNELEKKYKQLVYTNETLRDDYELVCAELEKSKDELERSTLEVTSLKESLLEKENFLATAKLELASSTEKLSNACTEIQGLRNSLQVEEDRARQLTDSDVQMKAIIEETTNLLFSATERLLPGVSCKLSLPELTQTYLRLCNISTDEVNDLRSNYDEKLELVEALQTEVRNLQQRLDNAERLKDDAVAELKESLTSVGADRDARIASLISKISDQDSQLSEQSNEMSILKQQLESKEKDLGQLRKRIESLISESDDNEQLLKGQLEKLSLSVNNSKTEISHLQAELHTKNQEISDVKDKFKTETTEKSRQINLCTSHLAESEKVVKSLQNELQEKSEKIDSLIHELEDLRHESLEVVELQKEISAERSNLDVEMTSLQRKVDSLTSRNLTLEQDYQSESQLVSDLKAKLCDLEVDSNSRLESSANELLSKSKELEEMTGNLDEKESRINELEINIKTMQDELCIKSEFLQQLESSVTDKENVIAQRNLQLVETRSELDMAVERCNKCQSILREAVNIFSKWELKICELLKHEPSFQIGNISLDDDGILELLQCSFAKLFDFINNHVFLSTSVSQELETFQERLEFVTSNEKLLKNSLDSLKVENNSLSEELAIQKVLVSEYEDFKKDVLQRSSDDNEELKKEITELQSALKECQSSHDEMCKDLSQKLEDAVACENELKCRMDELISERDSAYKDISDQKNISVNLEKEFEQTLLAKSTENSELSEKLESLTVELSTLKLSLLSSETMYSEKCEQLGLTLESVNKKLADVSSVRDELQTKFDQQFKNFTDFAKAVCYLVQHEFLGLDRSQLQAILKRVKLREKERSDSVQRCADLDGKLETLSQQIHDEKSSQSKELQQIRQDYENRISTTDHELQAKLSEISVKLSNAESWVDKFQVMLKSADEKLQSLLASKNTLKENVESLQKKLDQSERELTLSREQYEADKKDLLGTHQAEVIKMKEAFEAEKLIYQEDLKLEIVEYRKKAKLKLQEMKANLESEKTELSSKMSQKETQYSTQIDDLNKEILSMKKELEAKHESIASKDSEINDIKASLSFSDDLNKTSESELENMKHRLESSKASEDLLKVSVTSITKERDELRNHLLQLKEKLSALTEQVSKTKESEDDSLLNAQKQHKREITQLQELHNTNLKSVEAEYQTKLEEKEKDFQQRFSETLERFQKSELELKHKFQIDLEEMMHARDEKESMNSELQQSIKNLAAENDKLSDARTALLSNVEELKLKIQSNNEQLKSLSQENASLRDSLKETQIELEEALETIKTPPQRADLLNTGVQYNDDELLHRNASSHSLPLDNVFGQSSRSVSLEEFEALRLHSTDLQDQVNALNQELSTLRTASFPPISPATRMSSVSSESLPYQFQSLTEIPEIEYLRNVLFEYMLGRETQTLSKVICTVLKFSNYQTGLIQDFEQKKASSWRSPGYS